MAEVAGDGPQGLFLLVHQPGGHVVANVVEADAADAGLFEPTQAISVTEALKMWTLWAARSMGQADVQGSIEPGKYADLTVLSDDIFTIPKESLKDVKVLKTIVGGKVVYQAKEAREN